MVPIMFQIDLETSERIKKLEVTLDTTKSRLLRRAVKEFLEREEK
jgi:predicted transcriptional regulator